MALDYNCTICNRAIGYEGLCWKCKAEKKCKEVRNEFLALKEVATNSSACERLEDIWVELGGLVADCFV